MAPLQTPTCRAPRSTPPRPPARQSSPFWAFLSWLFASSTAFVCLLGHDTPSAGVKARAKMVGGGSTEGVVVPDIRLPFGYMWLGVGTVLLSLK